MQIPSHRRCALVLMKGLDNNLQEYPMSDARDLVERACLTRFLPRLPQEALIKAIEESEIFKETTTPTENQMLRCSVEDGMLTIGRTTTPIYNLGNQAKVPDVVFYDTDQASSSSISPFYSDSLKPINFLE